MPDVFIPYVYEILYIILYRSRTISTVIQCSMAKKISLTSLFCSLDTPESPCHLYYSSSISFSSMSASLTFYLGHTYATRYCFSRGNRHLRKVLEAWLAEGNLVDKTVARQEVQNKSKRFVMFQARSVAVY